MRVYLALGDSISIDDYTGVNGGGAASQLARTLGFELVDLTRDGNTTHGVLADLARAPEAADVVTITAGGNDLLVGDLPPAILGRLDQIARRIQPLGARVVINTIYDPSDDPASSVYPSSQRSRCDSAWTPSTAASRSWPTLDVAARR
jgi:lysophospholipase L1-like esterase